MEKYCARVVFSKTEDLGSICAENIDDAFNKAFEEWDRIRHSSTDYEDTSTDVLLIMDKNGKVLERSAP